jgi:prevent-host-death family protein
MTRTINAKELRGELPEIVRKVRLGQRYVVLYRSKPAFKLVPVDDPESEVMQPLDQDPVYKAGAFGNSADGLTSEDHDRLLYAGSDR